MNRSHARSHVAATDGYRRPSPLCLNSSSALRACSSLTAPYTSLSFLHTALRSWSLTNRLAAADRMHHAGLRHRLRPCGLDGLGQALEPVAAHDRHVRNAPVGHLRAHVRPERGSLRIPDPDARHVPEPLHVDADRAVHGLHTTLPPSPTFTRIASRHMTG